MHLVIFVESKRSGIVKCNRVLILCLSVFKMNAPFDPTTPLLRKTLELSAVFSKEPPKSHRKSNFMHFEVSLSGRNGETVHVQKSRFLNFIQDGNRLEDRNGVQYAIHFTSSVGPFAGHQLTRYLVIWVIDSVSDEIIKYEGSMDNPRHARVLLTHETGCMRCIVRKSCGSQIDSPADPMIIDSSTLRFKLRCNQNCLRAAGVPKNKKGVRKFRILVTEGYTKYDSKYHAIAKSRELFIHNSSKLGKKKGSPRITTIVPKSGFEGSTLVVLGDNFDRTTQVFLGDKPMVTQFETSGVLSVLIPDCGGANSCLPVIVRGRDQAAECDVPFHYTHRPVHECQGRGCVMCHWETSQHRSVHATFTGEVEATDSASSHENHPEEDRVQYLEPTTYVHQACHVQDAHPTEYGLHSAIHNGFWRNQLSPPTSPDELTPHLQQPPCGVHPTGEAVSPTMPVPFAPLFHQELASTSPPLVPSSPSHVTTSAPVSQVSPEVGQTLVSSTAPSRFAYYLSTGRRAASPPLRPALAYASVGDSPVATPPPLVYSQMQTPVYQSAFHTASTGSYQNSHVHSGRPRTIYSPYAYQAMGFRSPLEHHSVPIGFGGHRIRESE